MRISKGISLAAACAILAACSSNSSNQPESAKGEQAVDLKEPLKVPALSEFKDTPARALKGKYTPAQWANLPGWQAEQGTNLWLALYNNCRGLMRPVSGSTSLPARATPQAWQPVCQQIAQMGPNVAAPEAKQFIEQNLQPWQIQGQGMVTGYYEPVVHGSRKRHEKYQWPMYAVPDDLLEIDLGAVYPELAGKRVRGKLEGNRVVPYDARGQLAQSKNPPPVIAWLDDPIEAFFLQVQGSGRVQLEDGSMIRLAYANHNGLPYTSIGTWLINKGELSAGQASMQGIKQWAQAHPDRVQELLNVNKAMVFFKEEPIKDEITGPKGAYSIPLIGQRSAAVDPEYTPLGTPIYLDTTYPASQQPLQRIVMAQDTGAAIKGPARVDFYWGSGDEAGDAAGRMKQSSTVWMLWPKAAGEPSAR